MSDLETAIQQNKELSDKTRLNYKEKVRAIVNKAEGKPIDYIILHPNIYIPLFQKWYPKAASYKAHYTVIMALFKYNPTFKEAHRDIHAQWAEAFKEADHKVNERYEENAPSDRQIEGYVPFEQLISQRDQLPEGDIRRLLLGMYTHIRPLRAEFARCRIYRPKDVPKKEEDIESNYILLKGRGATLVLRQYKTRKHHDVIEQKLPPVLVKEITLSLKQQPRDYLFVNAKGEPYTQPVFSQWTARVFQQLFQKPLTLQLIRHSFINTLDFNTLTIKDKRSIAKDMAHDVATQDRYRLLFTDKNQKCDCQCVPTLRSGASLASLASQPSGPGSTVSI